MICQNHCVHIRTLRVDGIITEVVLRFDYLIFGIFTFSFVYMFDLKVKVKDNIRVQNSSLFLFWYWNWKLHSKINLTSTLTWSMAFSNVKFLLFSISIWSWWVNDWILKHELRTWKKHMSWSILLKALCL